VTRSSHKRSVPCRANLWPHVWRRRPLAVVLILVVLGLLIRARIRPSQGSDHDRYHNKIFTCVRVIDGDTIDIAVRDGRYPRTRIRLWGVDTPETDKSDRGAMYYGPEASAFTTSQVDNQPVRVVLAPSKTRGLYGRLLAYVYLGDSETMLNEEIVAQGYGYADRRFGHVWKERFETLEQRAHKQGLGLWRDVTPDQFPAWRQRYEKWRQSTTQQ